MLLIAFLISEPHVPYSSANLQFCCTHAERFACSAKFGHMHSAIESREQLKAKMALTEHVYCRNPCEHYPGDYATIQDCMKKKGGWKIIREVNWFGKGTQGRRYLLRI
jgi:hypothetical protein